MDSIYEDSTSYLIMFQVKLQLKRPQANLQYMQGELIYNNPC